MSSNRYDLPQHSLADEGNVILQNLREPTEKGPIFIRL